MIDVNAMIETEGAQGKLFVQKSTPFVMHVLLLADIIYENCFSMMMMMMRLRVGHRKEKKEEREGCNSQETPPFNRAKK